MEGRRSTKKVLALLVLGMAAALPVPAAHAVDPWPSDGQNAFNSRYSATGAPAPSSASSLRKLWEARFNGAANGTPILADNNGVYIGTEAGSVFVLPQDRSAQGSGVPDGGLVAGPQGLVFCAGYAQGPIRSSLLKVGGTIYGVANAKAGPQLFAMDALTCGMKWATVIDTDPAQRTASSCGGPQYSASTNLVIVGLADCTSERLTGQSVQGSSSRIRGEAIGIDATSGTVSWRRYLALPGEAGAGVRGTPAVWDATGRAYITTGHAYSGVAGQYTDSVVELDVTTGAILATFQAHQKDTSNNSLIDVQHRMGFQSSPLVLGRTDGWVAIGAQDGNYYLLDLFTLQLRKKLQLALPGDATGIPASAAWNSRSGLPNGTIYGVTSTPAVYFSVNPDTGTNPWVFPSADAYHVGPVTLSENALWSATTRGTLDVYSASDGHLLWSVPIGTPTTGGVSVYKDRVFVAEGLPGGVSGGVVAYQIPKK